MSNVNMIFRLGLVISSLAVGGCTGTLAPNYEKPAPKISGNWDVYQDLKTPNPKPMATATQWKDLITDQKLRRVVEIALDNNQDLVIAALNIERARAQYCIQRSELTPTIGAGLNGTTGRTPASVSSTGQAETSRIYQLGVGITSWELDFFGKIRSLEHQAIQDYLSTVAARRSAELALTSEVIQSYLRLAADLEQLQVAQATVRSRQDGYQLQTDLEQTGSSSSLETHQALAELENARDDELAWHTAISADKNLLEQLLGHPLPASLLPTTNIESIMAGSVINEGLPSDLLQRRPDIIAAEHSLKGANANIGAARAAYFPSISLTAGVGRASDSLGTLFSGSNQSWSFVPQINVPIFTGGTLDASLKVAETNRALAVAQYQKTVQAAFREVKDALAIRSNIDDRLETQAVRLQAAENAFALVEQRYDTGISRYLDVLDTQRTLYSAQRNLIALRLQKFENQVTLFKALGGEWEAPLTPGIAAKH